MGRAGVQGGWMQGGRGGAAVSPAPTASSCSTTISISFSRYSSEISCSHHQGEGGRRGVSLSGGGGGGSCRHGTWLQDAFSVFQRPPTPLAGATPGLRTAGAAAVPPPSCPRGCPPPRTWHPAPHHPRPGPAQGGGGGGGGWGEGSKTSSLMAWQAAGEAQAWCTTAAGGMRRPGTGVGGQLSGSCRAAVPHLHLHQVHHALEVLLGADGQLDHQGVGAQVAAGGRAGGAGEIQSVQVQHPDCGCDELVGATHTQQAACCALHAFACCCRTHAAAAAAAALPAAAATAADHHRPCPRAHSCWHRAHNCRAQPLSRPGPAPPDDHVAAAVEVGAQAVHLVDEADTGDTVLVSLQTRAPKGERRLPGGEAPRA